MENNKFVIALAGNPNVGKSTIFNGLTGMRQHTGNWPGKTVATARGEFQVDGQKYELVDLRYIFSGRSLRGRGDCQRLSVQQKLTPLW